MRHAILLVASLCFATTLAGASPKPQKPDDVVTSEGALVVTDGSSYYRFEKGGKFRSGPLGISGRTIEGTWTSDGLYTYTVEGTWGWLNGAGAEDRRRMVIGLQPPFELDRKTTAVSDDAKKIYSCYWTVDELVKLPKPAPKAPASAKKPNPF